jgi:hypothetical protein
MPNTIPTFDSFVADEDMDLLTREQVNTLLLTVHRFMASAVDIAVNHRYLAIRGGNLDYYAGLEYSQRNLAFEGRGFKVWELNEDGDRCNAASIAERARNILAGKPPYGEEE